MLPVRGDYYDGRIAARRRVQVTLDEGAGALLLTGACFDAAERWPLDRLRALPDHAQDRRLTLAVLAQAGDETKRGAARLRVTDSELIRRITALCPDLARQDLHEGARARIVKRGALALGALALMLFVILPRMADTLAGLIPPERERAFGRAVTAQIERALGATELGELHCTAPDGRHALDTLLSRLTGATGPDTAPQVTVLDHDMVNAFAAPGGQIVLMRGLLDAVDGPDAVAAVLAHEIGHVRRRDATRHALRAAGSAGLLSLVMGDFTGGALAVFLGERMLQASYTREAERQADRFALEMLTRAGIDSGGMADFFEHLTAREKGRPRLPGYLATHPASERRAARARRNAAEQDTTRPALSADQWRALRGICR